MLSIEKDKIFPEICDLIVISTFELYLLHMAIVSYSKTNEINNFEIDSALKQLASPQPFQENLEANPFIVLR